MARPQCSVLERQIAMRLMGLALEINLHAAIDEVKPSTKLIEETPHAPAHRAPRSGGKTADGTEDAG